MRFTRFMVPLDGEPGHEVSLQVASELAEKLRAELHLIRVVPTLATLPAEDAASGTLLPTTTQAVLDIAEEEACDYMREKLDGLETRGIKSVGEVGRGSQR